MPKFTWIAVAGASLTLAACGGDDDSNSQLSYADYGREANKVCQDADARIDPIGEKLTGEPQNDAPLLGQLAGEFESVVGDYKELKPPDELQVDHDEFVRLADQQIAITREAEQAAKSGDKAGYQAKLQEIEPLDKESDDVASRLGAQECLND